jgi:hypothetical protein
LAGNFTREDDECKPWGITIFGRAQALLNATLKIAEITVQLFKCKAEPKTCSTSLIDNVGVK